MGRRRNAKVAHRAEPSLEEQLRELDENAPDGPQYIGDFAEDMHLDAPSAARMEYVRKRTELIDRIRRRDAERLADPGNYASGNYSPSPHAAHGHVVERAPRNARKSEASQFPKRIATQRMIDRYLVRKLITPAEWRGGNSLWQCYCGLELAGMRSPNYDPDVIGGTSSPDRLILKKLESVQSYITILDAIPYRSRGCVTAVVILDWSASQWARGRGFAVRDSERHGLDRLRPGLRALADFWGY